MGGDPAPAPLVVAEEEVGGPHLHLVVQLVERDLLEVGTAFQGAARGGTARCAAGLQVATLRRPAVTVQRGSEPDIETAIVKKMIELIRKEKTGDFEWDSHRLGRVVTMSARPQDEQQLIEFLYKEMFPDYRPPRG